jgi:hypothetical protein
MNTSWRLRAAAWAVLAGVLLGDACVPEDSGSMPRLAAPAWQHGERSSYVVSRNDSVLYRSTLLLTFDEELGQPGAPAGTTSAAIPTAMITYVVEPVGSGQYFFDSASVVFRRDDFQPLRSRRSTSTEISDVDIEARYQAKRLIIHKQTVDGTQDQNLKLPERCFASDMLPTVLRAVPLESGTSFRINLAVPSEFRIVPVRISVLGTKFIKTDVGDLVCREIVAILPGRETRYWYEIAQPHRFAGMKDLETGTELRLESYVPAHADSLAPTPAAVR